MAFGSLLSCAVPMGWYLSKRGGTQFIGRGLFFMRKHAIIVAMNIVISNPELSLITCCKVQSV